MEIFFQESQFILVIEWETIENATPWLYSMFNINYVSNNGFKMLVCLLVLLFLFSVTSEQSRQATWPMIHCFLYILFLLWLIMSIERNFQRSKTVDRPFHSICYHSTPDHAIPCHPVPFHYITFYAIIIFIGTVIFLEILFLYFLSNEISQQQKCQKKFSVTNKHSLIIERKTNCI